jgi:Flp pilus assembly protein TadD
MARLLLDAGRSLEARDELEAVVVARPHSADARAALGLACYLSGDAETARSVWQKMLKEFPQDRRAVAYLKMLSRPIER